MPAPLLAQPDATANLPHRRDKLLYQGTEFSVIVAECDGTIVGCAVSGIPRYAAAPGAVELWSVNVDPDYWNSGFCFALVRRAATAAHGYGYSRVELWCIW
jgi:N-acetylglutamate synthase-like GNAT family acetyltransferase